MPSTLSSSTARNALVIIAVIVTGAALRWIADIIAPLLLALFLLVMVDGFARVIRRRVPVLPTDAALACAIALSVIALILGASIVAGNAGRFINAMAGEEAKLNALVARLAGAFGFQAPPIRQIFSQLNPAQYLGTVAQTLQGFTSSTVLVLIYLGFLIASRHAFERKVVKLFHDRDQRHEALHLFLRVRDSIQQYLWIQTVTGAIIAVIAWLIMMLVGLDNAFFWAFLVFVVNYVPIVGAAAAIVLPALFALVQFDGYVQAAVLLTGLFLVTFLVGNILLPRMQGHTLNMDPVIILLSLAFWGAILGITGMFLSTPLTVLVMLILAQFDGSRWMAVLLSGDGDPQGLGRHAARLSDAGGPRHPLDAP